MGTLSTALVAPQIQHRSGFLVSRSYDTVLLIGSPILALALGFAIDCWGPFSWLPFAIGSMVFAHVLATVVRTHLNPEIHRRWRVRFTVVPAGLLLAILGSPALQALLIAAVVVWDVWHSSLQTFGLGRMYDGRRGNVPGSCRRLDLGLNLVLYGGPLLIGPSLVELGQSLEHPDLPWSGFSAVAILVREAHAAIALAVVAAALPVGVAWGLATLRAAREGQAPSAQKLLLFATTAACTTWAWGFHSFVEAFVTVKLFHVIQYFALLAHAERRTVFACFRVDGARVGMLPVLGLLVVVTLPFGIWGEAIDTVAADRVGGAFLLAGTLLHFWYDGFVWSVRGSVR